MTMAIEVHPQPDWLPIGSVVAVVVMQVAVGALLYSAIRDVRSDLHQATQAWEADRRATTARVDELQAQTAELRIITARLLDRFPSP